MSALIDIEIDDDRWVETDAAIQSVIHRAANAALTAAGFKDEADLVILLCDDAEMRRLNKEYRFKDKATNVLSFPAPASMSLKGVMEHLGDLALGFETCRQESVSQNKRFADHVSHLIVHGCLHLLGFDHENDQDAEEMEALERNILAEIGIADPYSLT